VIVPSSTAFMNASIGRKPTSSRWDYYALAVRTLPALSLALALAGVSGAAATTVLPRP